MPTPPKKKPARAVKAATPTATPAKKKPPSHDAASIAANASRRAAIAVTTLTVAVLTRLGVGMPTITDAQIALLNAQIPDALALEIGRSTRSPNVIDLVGIWAPIIRAALDTFASVLASVGYTPVRFAYLLSLTSTLQSAMAAQTTTASTKTTAVATQSAQHDASHAVFLQLESKMTVYAGHSSADLTAIRALDALTTTDRELAAALTGHANLAATWLERTDDASEFYASTSGLSTADVTAASQAAAQLMAGAAAPGLTATSSDRDNAATNLAEGRVLAELRVAYKAFVKALLFNKSVPTLPLVDGTKHVFSRPAKKLTTTGTGDATIATPAPSGGTPPTGSAT